MRPHTVHRAAVRWDAVLTDHAGHSVALSGVNLMTWEQGLIVALVTFYDQTALAEA